jgi:hypothetical protein
VASEEGLLSGLKALGRRFRQCRPGFSLQLSQEGEVSLLLPDGQHIAEEHLSESLLGKAKALALPLGILPAPESSAPLPEGTF